MKIFRSALLCVGISAALVALSAFKPMHGRAFQHHPNAVLSSSSSHLVVMDCANECNEPACVSLGAHLNQSGSANYGPSHACALYATTCPHPTCQVTVRADSIARVVAAVDPVDEEALSAFLGVDGVEFNTSRSAFQFIGCNGEVVAQVSVNPDFAGKLSTHGLHLQ